MDTTKPPLMKKILQAPKIARYTVGIPILAIGIGLTILAIEDIWNVLFGNEYYGSFWDFCGVYLIIKFIGPLIMLLGYYIIDPEGATEIVNDSDPEGGSETNSAPSESIIIDVEDVSEPIEPPFTRP